MRLVTIDKSLLEKYREDPQVLYKDKRPYVLVIRLQYRGQKQDYLTAYEAGERPKFSTDINLLLTKLKE